MGGNESSSQFERGAYRTRYFSETFTGHGRYYMEPQTLQFYK